jgi:hypothetical protein
VDPGLPCRFSRSTEAYVLRCWASAKSRCESALFRHHTERLDHAECAELLQFMCRMCRAAAMGGLTMDTSFPYPSSFELVWPSDAIQCTRIHRMHFISLQCLYFKECRVFCGKLIPLRNLGLSALLCLLFIRTFVFIRFS